MLLDSSPGRPLALLPISINYDLCIDNTTYQRELSGQPKRKESLWSLFSSVGILFKRCGGTYLNIGEPICIDATKEATDSTQTARQIMQGICRATIATESARVASLLPGADQALNRNQLEQGVCDLNLLLTQLGTSMPAQDRSPAAMVTAMARRHQLSLAGERVLVSEQQSAELSYYRNNLAHALVMPGLMILLAARLPKPGRSTITRIMRALQPYLAAEFSLTPAPDEPVILRTTLLRQGLRYEDKQRLHPNKSLLSRALLRLAETVLLRQYLLVRIIAQQPEINEQQLSETTTALARHLQNWYDHRVPEYADQRQLQPLIDQLERQQLLLRSNERLSAARDLSPILRIGRKMLPDVLIQESERWLRKR